MVKLLRRGWTWLYTDPLTGRRDRPQPLVPFSCCEICGLIAVEDSLISVLELAARLGSKSFSDSLFPRRPTIRDLPEAALHLSSFLSLPGTFVTRPSALSCFLIDASEEGPPGNYS